MTPDEVATLQRVGQVTIDNKVTDTCNNVLYGVYCVLFAIMILTLRRRSTKGRSTMVLMVVSVITFFITSAYWASTISTSFILLRGGLLDHPDLPLRMRLNAANVVVDPIFVAVFWLNTANFTFADSVVLWRAWVISKGNKFAFVSLALLIGGFIASVVAAALNTVAREVDGDPLVLLTHAGNLQNASYFLSLGTNITATGLIGFEYIRHRRFMSKHAPSLSKRKSSGEETMINLVESGVIYCLFQINLAVLCTVPKSPSSDLSVVAGLFVGATTIISAIYPTTIIVLVSLRRSMVDTMAMDTQGTLEHNPNLTVGTHISFAHTNPSSTQGAGDIVEEKDIQV